MVKYKEWDKVIISVNFKGAQMGRFVKRDSFCSKMINPLMKNPFARLRMQNDVTCMIL